MATGLPTRNYQDTQAVCAANGMRLVELCDPVVAQNFWAFVDSKHACFLTSFHFSFGCVLSKSSGTQITLCFGTILHISRIPIIQWLPSTSTISAAPAKYGDYWVGVTLSTSTDLLDQTWQAGGDIDLTGRGRGGQNLQYNPSGGEMCTRLSTAPGTAGMLKRDVSCSDATMMGLCMNAPPCCFPKGTKYLYHILWRKCLVKNISYRHPF